MKMNEYSESVRADSPRCWKLAFHTGWVAPCVMDQFYTTLRTCVYIFDYWRFMLLLFLLHYHGTMLADQLQCRLHVTRSEEAQPRFESGNWVLTLSLRVRPILLWRTGSH